jgi:hypothetical protein
VRRRAALAAVLLGVGLVWFGCGKKGPPVAPERRLPGAPADLAAIVDGDAVVVSWTAPKRRVDNTPLRDLVALKLFRLEEPPGERPRPAMVSYGQVVGWDQLATVRLDAPAPAEVERDTVRWRDTKGLVVGKRYVYVVTAIDSTGRSSPPTERLAVIFLAAPGPPRGLAARAGDRRVDLTWQPPAALADGSPLSGELRYLVLRGPVDGPLAPITPQPISATTFADEGAANDTTYRYAVRAVRVEPSGQARGAESVVASATPADTTPPRPPTDLVAVPSPGMVRLSWRPSPDADVARYAIYRAERTGSFQRIGTAEPIAGLYTDRTAVPGRQYRYAVTALDSARTPNESPRSNEVSMTAE